jgi:hypothetical protein
MYLIELQMFPHMQICLNMFIREIRPNKTNRKYFYVQRIYYDTRTQYNTQKYSNIQPTPQSNQISLT